MPFTLYPLDREELCGLQILQDENSSSLTYEAGYDESVDEILWVEVRLSPVPAVFGALELAFNVLVSDYQGPKSTHNCGLQTKALIQSREDRWTVLQVICILSARLVRDRAPNCVVISTVDTNLPERALQKYEWVCTRLECIGYSGGRVDRFHGSDQWQLQRTV